MIETVTLEEALWESAKEAFETMIMLPIERVENETQEIETSKSVFSSITFTGPIKGAVVIKCAYESTEKIARSMLMMSPEDEITTEDIYDAAGEVANLVLGGLKSRIADSVGDIDMSIPMVIEGKEIVPSIRKDDGKIEVTAQGDGCKISFILIHKETT